jgi:DNA polymerase-1
MKLLREDILACKGLPVAIDTETTGLAWHRDKLIGIGLHCPKANVSGYAHTCTYHEDYYGKPRKREEWLGDMDYSKSKRGRQVKDVKWVPDRAVYAVPNQSRIDHFLPAVWEIAHDPNTVLIGHNLKFDAHFLQLRLWELPCKIIDTAVLVHLIDSNLKKSLEVAEAEFLGTASKRSHVSKADDRFKKSAWMWGEHVLEDYCANDCAVTYQLAEVLMPMIKDQDLKGMLSIQMKYLRLLQKIEWRGILVEEKFCHKAIKEFEKNISELEVELYDSLGKEFDWRSAKQLSKAIYEGLGIPMPKSPFPPGSKNAGAKMYTGTCTGTPLLLKIKHPARYQIVVLRETVKLKEYAEKYLSLRDSEGVLHSSFNITGTVTGRISSSEPNLQQLASKYRKYDLDSEYTGGTERTGSYNLRQSLVARPGYKILSIDHKQQEARLLAILSQEPTLLQFMAERKDVHLAIAIRVWGDHGLVKNRLHREWSKATVFG